MKCKVCGYNFELKKENKYIVSERVFPFFDYHEAFDCPKCGCQNIVNRRYVELKEDENEGEKEDDTER